MELFFTLLSKILSFSKIVQLRIFWSKTRIPILFVLFIVIVRYLISYPLLYLSKININFADPSISAAGAIIGTLVGAVIGGIMSYLATYHSSYNQIVAKSIIYRKNIIYSPLYDDLIKFSKLLNNNPFPSEFIIDSYTKENHFYNNSPEFTAWDRISNDTTLLQVPKYLSIEMRNFLSCIDKYLKARDTASEEIMIYIKDLFSEYFDTNKIQNYLGKTILQYYFSEKLNECDIVKDILLYAQIGYKQGEFKIDILPEKLKELKDQIIFKCDILPSFQNVVQDRNSISITLNELTKGLALLILYINKKYENQGNII